MNNDLLVITSYYFNCPNPQSERGTVPPNQIAYIYPWYISMKELGLNGMVMHDGLDESFISNYETNKIKFWKCPPIKHSANDDRFINALDIAKNCDYPYILLTDGSDLIIKKDPTPLFENHKKLWFGEDDRRFKTIKENTWCLHKLSQLIENSTIKSEINNTFLNFEYINAGVIGGPTNLIVPLLESLKATIEILSNNNNNNMLALNFLLWKFKIEHLRGEPLTSPYKEYALHGDYYIIHK